MTATTTKPAPKSRASRAAAQAKADAAKAAGQPTPESSSDEQPEQPTAEHSEQPEAADAAKPEHPATPEPGKPAQLTSTAKRVLTFAAAAKAIGDAIDAWDVDGVTAEEARRILAHRWSYNVSPAQLPAIWDSRLGPVATGRGQIPTP